MSRERSHQKIDLINEKYLYSKNILYFKKLKKIII